MTEIFVNLKRFDIPKDMGGICTMNNPKKWIEWIIDESVKNKLGKLHNLEVIFLLPEGFILPACEKLSEYSVDETEGIHVGCQGVYREDAAVGGNFGAFTTNKPAKAVKNMGSTWSVIGHSEERKDKLDIIAAYDQDITINPQKNTIAKKTVDRTINEEVICGLKAGLNVLLCIGEAAEEKGQGSFDEQKPRIQAVLREQLEEGLRDAAELLKDKKLVIAYEPIWAIGPGKIPPGAEYISFVSNYIKKTAKELYGLDTPVVYGGGLKEENAESISNIETIDGGLVALTRFTGEIGFYPEDLKKIVDKYAASK
jgi:triosephosphate isomerase (TIM)